MVQARQIQELDLERAILVFRKLTQREKLLALAWLARRYPPEQLRGVLPLLSVDLTKPATGRFTAIDELYVLDEAEEVVEGDDVVEEDPYEEVDEEYVGQSALRRRLGHEH